MGEVPQPLRITECRRNRGLTQKEVALGIGISERAYQRYEAGDRVPILDVLVSLADYFDVSIDYLVGRTDNPERL